MQASRSATALELQSGEDPLLVAAAQALRYRVFYEELGAAADPALETVGRDVDDFDALADHLVVIDRTRVAPGDPGVVGCYRLLRGAVAASVGGFYSAGEFDLSIFSDRLPRVVELGRACVHPDYRNGAVMQLLWRGIARYLEAHGLDLMLGCASLPGSDLRAHGPALAYLASRHLAPETLRPRALPARRSNLPTADAYSAIELEQAKRGLPALLKAYLRMGGLIGDGAVVDRQFNTVDVCLVLPTDRIQDRYLRHLATTAAGDALAA